MCKEELLEAVYPSVSTQTEGAFFSRELRKFSYRNRMDRFVDDMCWQGICKNLQKMNDDIRIYLDCWETSALKSPIIKWDLDRRTLIDNSAISTEEAILGK